MAGQSLAPDSLSSMRSLTINGNMAFERGSKALEQDRSLGRVMAKRRFAIAWLFGLILVSLLGSFPGGSRAAEHVVRRPGLVDLDPETRAITPAQARLEAEFADGRYREATAAAEQVLASVRARYGEQSLRAVPPLVNLATVLQRAGNAAAAVEAYGRAVRLVESTQNLRDLRLARPLYGMGLALHEAGRPHQAATVLAQAVFISRMNLGLWSLDQLEFYDALMESLIALGRYDDVAARQQARLVIVERATGAGSAEVLEALADAGGWLRRAGRYREERDVHQRRLALLRERPGASDASLVPVLRDVAQTYTAALEPDAGGVLALSQALAIEERQPAPSAAARAEILTELGDYYYLFRALRPADLYYERARKLLVEAEDRETLEALFGQPKALYVPQPSLAEAAPHDVSVAEALVRMTVDARGQPRDVEILELGPSGDDAARAQVLLSVGRARFRPRITANGAAATEAVCYRFRFRYPGKV